MKKGDDLALLVRAVTALNRRLGVEHPRYADVLRWLLANKSYIAERFGPDGDILFRMGWSSVGHEEDPLGRKRRGKKQQTLKTKDSRDALLRYLLKKRGRDSEKDFESMRQQYFRWVRRAACDGDIHLASLVNECLNHLDPPPANEDERELRATNGVLLDWYV